LHLKIVEFINENKNPTMRDLSDFLCVKSPTTTIIIGALVKSGKIKRISDKNDSRVVRLIITKTGRKFLRDSRRKLVLNLRSDFKKINGKDRRDLIKILEKIV
jgi:DNA-binding MarR family transcriptional regulator